MQVLQLVSCALILDRRRFTGEFVFGFEKVSLVDAKATKNSDLKLSAIVALDSNTLLVQERTDNSYLLSTITIDESANILGSKWDLAATSPSLESYTGVGTNAEVEKLIAASNKKIVFQQHLNCIHAGQDRRRSST